MGSKEDAVGAAAVPLGARSPFANLLQEAQSDRPAIPDPADPTELALEPAVPPPEGAELDALVTPSEIGRRPTRVVNPIDLDEDTHLGDYRLLERIGEGGMAVVHRAHQPTLDRSVAIKTLRPEHVRDGEVVSRFEREAASLARLRHGSVVQVLDLLTDEAGGRHIVMEWVEGIDLFDLLERGGALPTEAVLVVGLHLAGALAQAHGLGIFHRDIKPSNVRVSRRGQVKLMDFGVARDDAAMELTQIGLSVGTPAYMAPEQIRGEPVDGRVDVFGLGVLLFEVAAGRPPWPERPGANVALDVLREPAPDLRTLVPEAPRALAELLAATLEKDPEARMNMAELEARLAALVHEEGLELPYLVIVDLLAGRGLAPPRRASSATRPRAKAPKKKPKKAPSGWMGPLLVAHGLALAGLLLAAALTAWSPFGTPLP